jgi:hypothetical protein
MRQNPAIKTEQVISELNVGEALVSFLDERGAPAIVERAWLLPPASRIGPIAAAERAAVLQGSVLRGHYEQALDRESAYEKLKAAQPAANEAPAKGRTARVPGTPASPNPPATAGGSLTDLIFGSTGPRGGHKEACSNPHRAALHAR